MSGNAERAMLRWFNSDPVFWAFLLSVVALADAMGVWAAATEWPATTSRSRSWRW